MRNVEETQLFNIKMYKVFSKVTEKQSKQQVYLVRKNPAMGFADVSPVCEGAEPCSKSLPEGRQIPG